MTISIYLRAVSLFYRTVAPFVTMFSLLIVGASVLYGNWPLRLSAAVLLVKLLTFPAVWYLWEQLRPQQYWLYLNLHIAPWQLWAGVVLADTGLFSAMIWGLRQLAQWL